MKEIKTKNQHKQSWPLRHVQSLSSQVEVCCQPRDWTWSGQCAVQTQHSEQQVVVVWPRRCCQCCHQQTVKVEMFLINPTKMRSGWRGMVAVPVYLSSTPQLSTSGFLEQDFRFKTQPICSCSTPYNFLLPLFLILEDTHYSKSEVFFRCVWYCIWWLDLNYISCYFLWLF